MMKRIAPTYPNIPVRISMKLGGTFPLTDWRVEAAPPKIDPVVTLVGGVKSGVGVPLVISAEIGYPV